MYRDFLLIMREYGQATGYRPLQLVSENGSQKPTTKRQRPVEPGHVFAKLQELFQGEPDLIQGLVYFLPQEFKESAIRSMACDSHRPGQRRRYTRVPEDRNMAARCQRSVVINDCGDPDLHLVV